MSCNDFRIIQKINKKAKQAVIACIAIFAFLLCTLAPQTALAKSNPRYGAIVIDADTGLVLYQDRAYKKLHPASLTKMMTLALTFEALKRGKLKLHDRIKISKHAANMVPSKLGLEPGSTIKAEDAIYALVTKSANDVAVALAEHLGRTEGNFARMMTRKAHSLGMKRTHFRNASGLHDPRQVTSPSDIAKLAQVLVKIYPEYYHYFSTKTFAYQGKTYRNHNRLMGKYPGMDGLKTGYIQASGFNLAATAVRDNRRLIGVVFGGRTSKSRNAHMAEILDSGFAKIKKIKRPAPKAPMLMVKNVPVPEQKPDAQTAGAVEIQEISSEEDDTTRFALMNNDENNSMFKRMIGEGDYDIAVSKRLETGLIAVAAQKGHALQAAPRANKIQQQQKQQTGASPKFLKPASYTLTDTQDWAIQIGAFTTRERSNKALTASLATLPMPLKHAYAIIAPMKTDQGWIFRARLNGYTKANADKACAILKDCIAIPPQQAYQ